MKKKLLILPIILLFIGCSSDLEKSTSKTEDCMEDKYDDEKSKYESISEALTAYDFESARVLLGCYEDACFDQADGDRTYCTEYSRGRGKKMVADRNPYYKNLLKIVSAEVTYFFKLGEYNSAKSSAMEAEMFFVYNKELPNLINNLIDKSKVDEALSILSMYTFSNSINKNGGFENSNINSEYNKEANKFNDMINSLFNDALFKKNKSTLRKCLLLYVPIVENDDQPYFSKKRIVNSYKNNARNKLKEAGIRL